MDKSACRAENDATDTSRMTGVSPEARLAAVMARDAACDQLFVYAVRTTGVYCRPSCGARAPRPSNIEYFATCAAAERAGYRACKRCQPKGPDPRQQNSERVTRLCRLIDASEQVIPLARLAEHVGLSPSRTQRLFKRVTGVSPTQYAIAQREQRVRRMLTERSAARSNSMGRGSITDTVYACGYNSSGRFYARAGRALGMSPARYRALGEGERIRVAVGACDLGDILVAATERGVCSVALGDDPEMLLAQFQREFARAAVVPPDTAFEQWVAQVVGLVQLGTPPQALPLDLLGTVFQQRVWHFLAQIPFGETRTYSEIAERLGDARLARAVASACAANRVAVAIPCHRVVRRDGSLSGYRWGVERKQALLDQERRLGGE